MILENNSCNKENLNSLKRLPEIQIFYSPSFVYSNDSEEKFVHPWSNVFL